MGFNSTGRLKFLLSLGVYDSSLVLMFLQGFMIVDRTSLYGRNMLDQHREMRMDIDNMSYEVIIVFSLLIMNIMCCKKIVNHLNVWLY